MGNFLRNRFSNFTLPNEAKKNGFYPFFRTFQSNQQTEVTVNGRKILMFGSNSYLGLTTHPKILEASKSALLKYGSSCSGSRFLNGTTDLHEKLEEKLANFLNKEQVLVFSTGFQVNLGVIPAIATLGDTILLDRLNHASLFEGARLSNASTVIFRHNDMESLERKLKNLSESKLKLIAVDGIFSMEGDIVKLPEIVALAKKYDATIMTDCAHAIGVIGDYGRGTPNHFNLNDDIDLIGGTFSKSLASLGGFIAGDKETIEYIKHHARSLIFSASMTPASTAAALEALSIISNDDSLRLKLWDNTRYALNQLNELGFDTGDASTPIIPIYIRNDKKAAMMTSMLFEEGVFVNPVIAPAVAPGNTLIRFSLMATHSKDQIDLAIEKIVKVADILEIRGEMALES